MITMSLTPDEVRAILRYREEQRHEDYLVVTRDGYPQGRCKCGWRGPERIGGSAQIMAERDADAHTRGALMAWDKDYALGRLKETA